MADELVTLFKRVDMVCPFCAFDGRVVFRARKFYEDKTYEDRQYFCNACQKEWWADGLNS